MRALIGTSWKMNLTSSEAHHWFAELLPRVAGLDACDLFVLPPYTSIWVARDQLRGTGVAWGAQDVHPDDAGAHTGDVSAAMLADLGCSFVEVGHSERRRAHRETSELIAAKVAAVLRWGMRPIICVGEPRPVPPSEVLPILEADLGVVLEAVGGRDLERVVVAYEPHWAIGEGARPASPEHVGAVCAGLGDWLLSRPGGARSTIIYGGSVDEGSAPAVLETPGVDGLFVGRYALDPERFARIAWAGARHASLHSAPGTRGSP
jgi:triosephosphate isomerase